MTRSTRAVLWDSSAVLVLLDARDRNHARAVPIARRFSFAVADKRRVAAVFTFDHHFRQYDRFPVCGS